MKLTDDQERINGGVIFGARAGNSSLNRRYKRTSNSSALQESKPEQRITEVRLH